MFKKMGFVDQKKGWKWLKDLEDELKFEKWNGKINQSGRKSLWFGLGVDLGFNSKVFEGKEISQGLRKRGNELWEGEDWNSILVYKYEKGIELKEHIDREIFANKTIIINFSKSLVGFKYDKKIHWLGNGEIIEIDNKKLHGISKVNEERWSLSIRKIL